MSHEMDHAPHISAQARRICMVGLPLVLGGLLLLHPNSYGQSADQWIETLAGIKDRWLLQHMLQLPLFAGLGVIVWWMLPGAGTASQVSRLALAAYIVVYPAFDALVGIGSGVLLAQRAVASEAERAVFDAAIQALFFDTTGVAWSMAVAGSVAWTVGATAAAIAVSRVNGWRVGLPLLLSGLVLGSGHVSPQGPIASVLVSVAAWEFLRQDVRQVAVLPVRAAA